MNQPINNSTDQTMARPEHKVSEETVQKFNDKLTNAMNEIEKTDKKIEIIDPNTGDKKRYTQVHVRNEVLRRIFGFEVRILTRIHENTEYKAVIEAVCDMLMDGKFVRIANAFGEKTRNEMVLQQLKSGLLPYAETSAIGRLLANLGLSGGEFASVEDVLDVKGGSLNKEEVAITNEQKKKIESLLKSKKVQFNDIKIVKENELDSIEDLNYEMAFSVIEELDKLESKVRRRTGQNKQTKQTPNKKVVTEDKKVKENNPDDDPDITIT